MAWATFALLLVSNVPLHVAMPLASDTVLYDLQARNLLAGGVLYRDIFETNLPGIVWLHAILRPLAGWSSEAIRLVDLAIVAGIVWLLVRFLGRQRVGGTTRIAAAAVVFWCYLSVSEWCHCQRDTWMLLPALAAFFLRLSQHERLSGTPHQPDAQARAQVASGSASGAAVFLWALAEGLVWAVAFWIKPFVAVPALACVLVTAVRAWTWRRAARLSPACLSRVSSFERQAGRPAPIERQAGRPPLRIGLDAVGLLCGGLLAGLAGVVWLRANGAWPYFLETFLEWNPDYVAGGRSRWTLERMYGLGYRLFPWLLVHVAAVPVAVAAIRRSLTAAARSSVLETTDGMDEADGHGCIEGMALFAALYLGWLVQAIVFQQPFDYIQVPPMLLGLTLVAAAWPRIGGRLSTRLAAFAFVLLAALASPTLKSDRLAGWWDAINAGSTPEVRDRLAYLRTPEYVALEHVAEYLRSQIIRDGEVTCYHVHLIHLYADLGLRPSTRYVGIEALRRLFPRHRELIDETVAASGHRFVVTDLVEAGLSVLDAREVWPGDRLRLPPAFPTRRQSEFPWNLPVVFRAGRYLVHSAHQPEP